METAPHIRLILWKAARAVDAFDRASIAESGLKPTDFAILEVLLHKGPQLINAIGDKVLLSSGSMTAAVNRLDRAGMVRRVQDPADGRCFHVHLTEDGRRHIRSAYRQHADRLEQLVDPLSERDKRELVRLLKKIGRQADHLNNEQSKKKLPTAV